MEVKLAEVVQQPSFSLSSPGGGGSLRKVLVPPQNDQWRRPAGGAADSSDRGRGASERGGDDRGRDGSTLPLLALCQSEHMCFFISLFL